MTNDNMSSKMSSSLAGEPSLPADFAQRVLLIARRKLRRRRLRNRIAAITTVLLLIAAIPLATLTRSRHNNLSSRDSTDIAGGQVQWSDEALAYQLEQNRAPRSAGDYLLPNAATLTEFTPADTDLSRQYETPRDYYR